MAEPFVQVVFDTRVSHHCGAHIFPFLAPRLRLWIMAIEGRQLSKGMRTDGVILQCPRVFALTFGNYLT